MRVDKVRRHVDPARSAHTPDRSRPVRATRPPRPRRSARPRARSPTTCAATSWAARPRAFPGPATGRTLAVVGHIDEIGLIVTHIEDTGFLRFIGVGGWDPQVLIGQRVELATQGGADPRRRRQEADPPAQGRRAHEGARAQGAAHRHRRRGRRRRARARARRRRRGDRRRAGRAAERPRRLALDGQPARLLRRLRGRRGWSPRRAARPATSSPSRRVQEETDLQRRAHDRAQPAPGHRDRGRRDASPPTRPGIAEQELGKHHFGSGPVIERGTTLHPVVSELLIETAEAEGIPYTLSASARGTGHRRRRDPHLARRRRDRPRLDPAALHALAGRDGAARRRREHREADRGVRAAAAGRRRRSSAERRACRAAAVRHRRHAADPRRARARDGAARRDRGGAGASTCARSGSRPAAAPTRTIARESCCAAASTRARSTSALEPFQRGARRALRRSSCPDDLSRAAGARARARRSPRSTPTRAMRLSLVTGNVEGVARLKLRARRDRRRTSRRARAGSAPTPRTAPTCRRSRARAPAARTAALRGRASAPS